MTVLSLTWESPYLRKTVFILRWGPVCVSTVTGWSGWLCYTPQHEYVGPAQQPECCGVSHNHPFQPAMQEWSNFILLWIRNNGLSLKATRMFTFPTTHDIFQRWMSLYAKITSVVTVFCISLQQHFRGTMHTIKSLIQRCQHSIFKMLNDFETQSEKCLIYDEMIKNFPIFCLISQIFLAYIKHKWRFQWLKWVMIKQNE